MENIKKILNEFEAPYNHNDWIKLEKDLPKPSGLSGLTKTILVAVAIIIAIGTVVLVTNLNSDNDKVSDKDNSQLSVNDGNEKPNINTANINTISNVTEKSENAIVTDINTSEHQSGIEKLDNTEILPNQETNNDTNIPVEKNNSVTSKSTNDNSAETEKLPSVDNIIFSVEISENCIPAKIVFRAINVPESCEIIWNTDENNRVYGKTANHTYLSSGIYEPEAIVVYNNFVLKTEKLRKITINEPTLVKINFENSENLYYFTCNNKEELRLLWSIDNQQFSEKETNYEFTNGGEYLIKLVAVNEYGCKSETSEKINIVIEHVYFVPNAFIPNSNGVNSSFGPIGEEMDFVSYKLIIVDGNGNAVFESDSPEFMWNGKINNIGAEVKPGFYLWEIKTLDKFGNLQTKKGRVNLIRN